MSNTYNTYSTSHTNERQANEQQAIEYAVKVGMLKALLAADRITERQFHMAMDRLREQAEVAA